MKKIVIILLMLFVKIFAYSQEDPKILADRYLIKAQRCIDKNDYQNAITYFDKIMELDVDVIDEFYYFFGKALFNNNNLDEAKEKEKKYIYLAGTSGKYYTQAQNLIIDIDDKIEQNEKEENDNRHRIADQKEREMEEIENSGYIIFWVGPEMAIYGNVNIYQDGILVGTITHHTNDENSAPECGAYGFVTIYGNGSHEFKASNDKFMRSLVAKFPINNQCFKSKIISPRSILNDINRGAIQIRRR